MKNCRRCEQKLSWAQRILARDLHYCSNCVTGGHFDQLWPLPTSDSNQKTPQYNIIDQQLLCTESPINGQMNEGEFVQEFSAESASAAFTASTREDHSFQDPCTRDHTAAQNQALWASLGQQDIPIVTEIYDLSKHKQQGLADSELNSAAPNSANLDTADLDTPELVYGFVEAPRTTLQDTAKLNTQLIVELEKKLEMQRKLRQLQEQKDALLNAIADEQRDADALKQKLQQRLRSALKNQGSEAKRAAFKNVSGA